MNEELTEESKTRKAYQEGLKLQKSGLNEEVIYARLEKQGFSVSLAREVASNVILEKKKDQLKDESSNLYIALSKIGLGLVMAFISTFIVPDAIFIPIGLIVGGIAYAVLTNEKIKKLK
jgi:hypothetical protein